MSNSTVQLFAVLVLVGNETKAQSVFYFFHSESAEQAIEMAHQTAMAQHPEQRIVPVAAFTGDEIERLHQTMGPPGSNS